MASHRSTRDVMARAFVDASGSITVPCSGVVQAAIVLPLVQASGEMLALLRSLVHQQRILAATRASMLSGYRNFEPAWQWTHEDGSDARVYENNDRAYLLAFSGHAGKPTHHYVYRDAAKAIEAGIQFILGRKAHAKMVGDRRAKQSAFRTTLTEGRVLVSSWGYDQTNIDYYQVTRVIGAQTVEIRKIAARSVDGQQYMTGSCWPLADHFIGEPMVKRVQEGEYVSLTSYSSARPWDGKLDHWTAYA